MTIDYEIKFDRSTKDYQCIVDGRTVGYRATYGAGDSLCRQVVADLLADGLALTAAELDGGADDDEEGSCDDINAPPDRARAVLA